MSDTPKTDAAVFTVDVAFVSHDGLASEPEEVVEPDFARQLERENAALRSLAAAMADEMEQHGGEQAFDSLARYRAEIGKEAKPCQCTNGIVRSVGRDNEEIIEDCPNCSPSKETQS